MKVYPRGCGGTQRKLATLQLVEGLSPRVRGNQVRRRSSPPSRRSIPAGAGEPRASAARNVKSQVYPRGCGGTMALRAYPPTTHGLSPRVRGNLELRHHR